MLALRKPAKIVIVSQHYAPSQNTTATIITAIATQLAKATKVLVLSGTPGAPAHQNAGQPIVIKIKSSKVDKTALSKRALLEVAFSLRMFIALLANLRRGDVVLTVTAPFMLPYAVAAAARLKRARTILIMHDIYPDVLIMAGLLPPTSIAAKAIHLANAWMFQALDSAVTIGRDMEHLLMRYKGMTRDKMMFIPNWATVAAYVRPIVPDNIYRSQCKTPFVVGLSGNLGFTHDPDIVFDAAILLKHDPVHFLLSGWGKGFERLKERQAEMHLPNVTLIDRVTDEKLEEFLSAANIWIIPYRKDVAGVSVPSRFYNLLAIGRPILIVSEADAEAAMVIRENQLGWVAPPGDAFQLANMIRGASLREDLGIIGLRAAEMAMRFSKAAALLKYQSLAEKLLKTVDL